jgi:hypothetical protein
MENLQHCPGRVRSSDSSRKWYVPPGKTSHECTYCESCFLRYVKNIAPNAEQFTMVMNLFDCNCDYPKDYSLYGLEKDNIRVTVSSKNGEMLPKIDNTIANLNGVMHVLVPTCTEYNISVEQLEINDDIYLTFESGSVGSKSIVMNEGKRLYYPTELTIKGFKTGNNESFMFISQSSKEKEEGKTLDGENETNVITITVKKWKRGRQTYPYYATHFMQSQSRGLSKGGCSKGMSRGGCENEMSRSKGDSDNECFAQSSAYSGGATVSGGSYVGTDTSRTTNDTFSPLGEPIEFLIQLVCSQSNDEKYKVNKQYYLKKDIAERDELKKKLERAEHELASVQRLVEKYQSEAIKEQEKIDQLKSDMKKFDYLGSTDKKAHLLDFTETTTQVNKIGKE